MTTAVSNILHDTITKKINIRIEAISYVHKHLQCVISRKHLFIPVMNSPLVHLPSVVDTEHNILLNASARLCTLFVML
jgi:hypothetical protein